MNYRDYKKFHPGGFFHVYNRGHNKNLIFKDDEDYSFFLSRAKQIMGLQKIGLSRWIQPLPLNLFSILSFCLMPNHFHFLVHQKTDLPVSKLMSKLATSYSIFFNKKYNQVGSIFQDQFKAKLVDDDSYLTYLSIYIHKNPSKPYQWPYSSLSSYTKEKGIIGSLVENDLILSMVGGIQGYKKLFATYEPGNELSVSHLMFEEE